jgi:hypothetical protein
MVIPETKTTKIKLFPIHYLRRVKFCTICMYTKACFDPTARISAIFFFEACKSIIVTVRHAG